jgi:aryl-alcohol dehydrogenase-like predicted oxidoreductase
VLGYLLGQPFPTFPIIGPKKMTDLEESLKAANTPLGAANITFLVN